MIELSVVIVSRCKDTRSLRASLESLRQQTQPATDFEVIVVRCNFPNDSPPEPELPAMPYLLRCRHQSIGRIGAACNLGLQSATGTYCLFLEDTMLADPGLIEAHIRAQREHNGVFGLGPIRSPNEPTGGFARYIVRSRRERYRQLEQGEQPDILVGCKGANISIPRSAALDVGGFATDLVRHIEIDIAHRLAKHSVDLAYIPEAIACREYHESDREIADGAAEEGMTDITLYRKRPAVLPHLQLGSFSEPSPRSVVLRRALLAMRMPIHPLLIVGRLLHGRPQAHDWYRFLFDYCYWHGVRRSMVDRDTWRRLTHGTPILMYHAIGHTGERPSRYILPRRRFALQMAWLKCRRYHVLSLEQFLLYQRENCLLPVPSVVITLDDGYADNWFNAYPILRRHGFPATIFIVSGLVGATNKWDYVGEVAGRALLSWPHIREMLAGGLHFGAHTRTHISLADVSRTEAVHEVETSRMEIEQELKVPIRTFSYPNGSHNSVAERVVEDAGFLGACCSQSGVNEPATPLFALRRTEIRGTDSLLRFLLVLWFGWSRFPSRRRSVLQSHALQS